MCIEIYTARLIYYFGFVYFSYFDDCNKNQVEKKTKIVFVIIREPIDSYCLYDIFLSL